MLDSIGAIRPGKEYALAESINGLYKTELIRNKGLSRGLDGLELATFEWFDWFSHRRLFHELGRIPPAEFEDLHYRRTSPAEPSATHTRQSA